MTSSIENSSIVIGLALAIGTMLMGCEPADTPPVSEHTPAGVSTPAPTPTPTPTSTPGPAPTATLAKTPVIYDTDMAIDDWSALLLLAKHPSIDLLAVTANGAGETRCGPAMANIPALLDLTDIGDVAIACGDDFPLDGYFAFPEPWRQQADTLSGVPVPPSDRPVSDAHPVEVIHNTIAEQDGPVTLLTVGSLTSIAQWLDTYPEDQAKIDRLVIMGGAFDAPGNIIVPGFTGDHPNTDAEWNIYVDPIAAQRVVTSGMNIFMVGLDVTNTVKVTTEFAVDFKAKVATPASEFWDAVLDDNDWFIDSGEYYFWDVLAALVVIDPSFCEGPKHPITVLADPVDGPDPQWTDASIPDTTTAGPPRRHFDPKTAGITRIVEDGPPVTICQKSDASRAFTVFTETMNLAATKAPDD